jgi:hypothetical protein
VWPRPAFRRPSATTRSGSFGSTPRSGAASRFPRSCRFPPELQEAPHAEGFTAAVLAAVKADRGEGVPFALASSWRKAPRGGTPGRNHRAGARRAAGARRGKADRPRRRWCRPPEDQPFFRGWPLPRTFGISRNRSKPSGLRPVTVPGLFGHFGRRNLERVLQHPRGGTVCDRSGRSAGSGGDRRNSGSILYAGLRPRGNTCGEFGRSPSCSCGLTDRQWAGDRRLHAAPVRG